MLNKKKSGVKIDFFFNWIPTVSYLQKKYTELFKGSMLLLSILIIPNKQANQIELNIFLNYSLFTINSISYCVIFPYFS